MSNISSRSKSRPPPSPSSGPAKRTAADEAMHRPERDGADGTNAMAPENSNAMEAMASFISTVDIRIRERSVSCQSNRRSRLPWSACFDHSSSLFQLPPTFDTWKSVQPSLSLRGFPPHTLTQSTRRVPTEHHDLSFSGVTPRSSSTMV